MALTNRSHPAPRDQVLNPVLIKLVAWMDAFMIRKPMQEARSALTAAYTASRTRYIPTRSTSRNPDQQNAYIIAAVPVIRKLNQPAGGA